MQTNSNVELMNPKIDFAFKEIMLDVEALKGFLGSVLNINPSHIKEIIYKNTNMSKVHQDDKQSILDVRIMIETEKTQEDQNSLKEIDIEMQMQYMNTWGDRSLFYVAKMITEQVDIDQKYSNMKKAIGINILNFNYMKQLVDFHTTYHLSEDKTHIKLSEMIEVHLIELPKIPKNSDGTYLYKWAKFFTAKTREEFQMITQGDKYLEAAFKRLEVISQDEEKRLEYTARQKALYDHNTLMEENFANGRATERAELIAKWKAKGKSDEEINELLN